MPISGSYFYPGLHRANIGSWSSSQFIPQTTAPATSEGVLRMFASGSGNYENLFFRRQNGEIIDLVNVTGSIDLDVIDELNIQGVLTSSTNNNVIRFSSSIDFLNIDPGYHLNTSNSHLILSSSAGSVVHISGSLEVDGTLTQTSTTTAFVSKTSDYKVTDTDHIIAVDTYSNDVEIMLLTAASIPGREYVIKRISSGSFELTIAATGSETIDGQSSYTVLDKWTSMSLISDGTNWLIV